MRIIGGKFRGKKLVTPQNKNIRPTTDRMRETLFNMLEHGTGPGIRNSVILDLFSGTGALGIEALSRGARHVTFVDKDTDSLKLTKQNALQVSQPDACHFILEDGIKITPRSGPFDVIFMDPPYQKNMILPAIHNIYEKRLLSQHGIIVVEHEANEETDFTDYFTILKSKKIGDAAFSILCPKP